jgi:hypothetical protein
MLTKLPFLLLCVFLLACSSRSRTLSLPLPKTSAAGMKTPKLILPEEADEGMKTAASAFHAYANSDEFYDYVRGHVKGLEAGNENDLEVAITKYRSCLSTHEPITIVLKKYSLKNRSKVLGGWRKTYLAQNLFKELNPIERAAHWVHELTHACGFTHFENDIAAYPAIKRSWPYQVGNAFRDFLREKTSGP